ncbi:MAG: HD domain-containing protein [Bacteroidales bacterium]|nr:HD domain-containing protein [Clostridium sp.]MCM1203552.1 HD domain-containing protein [Bacteroidales bacterium]
MESKKYYDLSEELQKRIADDRRNGYINPCRARDEDAVRRRQNWDRHKLLRPAYVRDCEKIMHTPYYNRYADKTQVFSFYKNDDITRRALHVQLVSRIARNIGMLLGLNVDLIEAISLGHDIGHTPFGHAGERYLSECLQEHTGRFFHHNVHSVRVLEGILNRNVSLQTLDGILCHNGEFAMKEYRPVPIEDFARFDEKYEQCYVDKEAIGKLVPYTMEACVVRICDMIAYLGKDRQDAKRANLIADDSIFDEQAFGKSNPEIINNLIVNIVENSYGRDCIVMDEEYYRAIKATKKENYDKIYFHETVDKTYEECIRPMFHAVYEKLLADLKAGDKSSVIYKHHIDFIKENTAGYGNEAYRETEPNQIVVDFIASMTDDYFIDLFAYLFPDSRYKIEYVSYFHD